jgi:polyisoprenoid-binding protein YceI
MVLTSVHGKFTDFSGILELEDNDLSKSSVSVAGRLSRPT